MEIEGTAVRVGTAGWRIPKELRDRFPDWGDRTQLWGYARRLDAVEINRTFRKLPCASTFSRWADRVPGGDARMAYFRLHGSPEMYRSPYRGDGLKEWESRIRRAAVEAEEVWCVFDNTAEGEGMADALALLRRLENLG